MLKLNFKLAIVILTVALFAVSCEKETEMVKTEPTKTMDATEAKILNFKDEMGNPDKSGRTFSIDSAVWYVEAALNYTYCVVSEYDSNNATGDAIMTELVLQEVQIGVGQMIPAERAFQIYRKLAKGMEAELAKTDNNTRFYHYADVSYSEGEVKLTTRLAEKASDKVVKAVYKITKDWD